MKRLSLERLRLIKKIVLTIIIAVLLSIIFFGIGYWAEYSMNKELIEAGLYVIRINPVTVVLNWACGMICSIFPIGFLGLGYFLLKDVFKLKIFN